MDVLVLWDNGTKNIVDSRELKLIRSKHFSIGCHVKMLYDKVWYKGKVIAVEDEDTSDSDDLPLSRLKETQNIIEQNKDTENQELEPISAKSSSSVSSVITDSDADPTFGQCELSFCKNEVFSACHKCEKMLCYDHFLEEVTFCSQHGISRKHVTAEQEIEEKKISQSYHNPEDYLVEGAEKEARNRPKKSNKQKLAKILRDKGEQYVSPKSNKIVPARFIKERCNSVICKKFGKQCDQIDEEHRKDLFEQYYALQSLTRQREFLSRHMERESTQRKTTRKPDSRRSHTVKYYLTKGGNRYVVCKKLFLNTLSISARTCRTVFAKLTLAGILDKENRGGRQRSQEEKQKEEFIRRKIEEHIERFPRVESHYCRSSSSKQYLHPDLSLPKMYNMFLEHLEQSNCGYKTSYYTYRRVFKKQNLSFHNPKKDQCSLCMTYKQGGEDVKSQLEEVYKKHEQEKKKVRELKAKDKEIAKGDEKFLCAVFDLQQVIYLPISKENAIYYKSRLSNFNLTFYNIGNKDCFCFPWYESLSKRGSSEIATCVFKALEHYAKKGITEISLYSDGCYGQNKNSIVAAMILYTVSTFDHVKRISLRFFESNHGQNEGDSAHSAIHTAISGSGDIFEPSQLHPIFRLARRRQPYLVKPMNYSDFIDFKKLSQDLRILSVRVSEGGHNVKWTEIKEFMVTKSESTKLFFKYSHFDDVYDAIELKRTIIGNLKDYRLQPLNKEPLKIPRKNMRI